MDLARPTLARGVPSKERQGQLHHDALFASTIQTAQTLTAPSFSPSTEI